MDRIACIFPGQGSQAVGMGREAARAYPEAAAVFQEADDALEFGVSRLCFDGPEEELRRTAITQPGILTVSVALWRVLAVRGLAPAFAAGHSLGEYSALVAAGSLSFRDAVRTVHLRGRWMQEAVPEGEGAMAALLGMEREAAEEVCREASRPADWVAPANFNAPGQVVVAGHRPAVDRVVALAAGRDGARSLRLPVSAPFHCRLMRPAQARLGEFLAGIPFADPAFPVVSNVDAALVRTGVEARRALTEQVTAPVRWEESMRLLASQGVRQVVEVGPGKVLCGLMRRIDRSVQSAAVGEPAGVDAALGAESP